MGAIECLQGGTVAYAWSTLHELIPLMDHAWMVLTIKLASWPGLGSTARPIYQIHSDICGSTAHADACMHRA
jgi:hypothetical protein